MIGLLQLIFPIGKQVDFQNGLGIFFGLFILNIYKNKFNKKYGFDSDESHSLAEISKATKIKVSALQDIYDKGIGAYKTNPQSVRPNVTGPEQWGYGRVNGFLHALRTGSFKRKAFDVDLLPSCHPQKKKKS